MRCLAGVLVLLLSNHYVLASSNECRNTDQCDCTNSSEEYQFQCPPSNKDGVVIHAKPDQNIILRCLNKEFDLDILPNYTDGKIDFFVLRRCSLSQDGFFYVLKKFGIEILENLRLEDVVIMQNSSEETVSITKEFFQGLSSLQTLDISYLSSSLEIDAFDNLTNLTILKLEHNNIEEISGMFRSLKSLIVLYLSSNSLSYIPNNTFRNLSKLQQLHLWNNHLTNITKSYFSGLHNLKSLDLSNNYIQFIDNDAFSDLLELVEINLRANQLGHIGCSVFRQNKKLKRILMEYNFNITLEDHAFANLKNLLTVNLEHSGLQNISEHVFEGSENIQILNMQSNFLRDLPEEVFSGLKHLKELDLTGNNISSLADELFSPLVGLEDLRLGDNQISEINENIFKRTENLKQLYLDNNRINKIAMNSFNNNQKLTVLDISNNLHDIKYEHSNGYAFMSCKNLEELLLSGNQIDEFPSNITFLVHLKKLDLRYNNIRSITVSDLIAKNISIDLRFNEISKVDFKNAEVLAKRYLENFKKLNLQNNAIPVTRILLYDNLLACDCDIYNLVQYIKDEVDPALKKMVELELDDKCASSEIFQDVQIYDLQPQDIICPYMQMCESSSDCQCFYRPSDQVVVVDCSYRNLTECPRIKVTGEKVEMNLTGNMIRQGPNSSLGYDNVTNMFLSNNSIEQFRWVPPKVKTLKLDGNQLTHLDSKVLKMLETTSNLTLSDNPWTCDCSASEFQNFTRNKLGKASKDIVCKEDNKLLIEKELLCKPMSTLIAIIILLFILFIAVGTTLYFYYQEEIKIWIFEWFPGGEEEIDKGKKFDIFLSYSHKDEDFVHQNLLSVLEQGPNPYDICIHERNWVAGEYIMKQILDSVNDSRRTLVVLSNDFLESVWGKIEFRTAHTKAIKEGRARVIIIKYGEIDEEKLDEEMKMYLKTNTYVEWGEPWFWRKLRYALPHSRSRFRNTSKDQKRANMMLKIDDKFDLSCPPLAHNKSALPVRNLDRAMPKNSPLSSHKLETPPAETPLVITIERGV